VTASFLNGSAARAEEKPRIGVLRFTNQTAAGWWRGSASRPRPGPRGSS
jgi:hypothetical protein